MFAKFSPDPNYVSFVSEFNLFVENLETGEVTSLTSDGNGDIINGTFDWAYEEEFGCRDGFRWSPDGQRIAFWQLDASEIGTFYMINNIDSIYPIITPFQYPKVGQTPSSARVGIVRPFEGDITWIDIPGDPYQNYIPRMQWIKNDLLLIQQLNRKQNHLIYWTYDVTDGELLKKYEEKEDTWVDIDYPDISSDSWGMYDLAIIDGSSVIRMSENGDWRHAYLVNLLNGSTTLLTPGEYDVASLSGTDENYLYFMASPFNSTQRFLYSTPLDGSGNVTRLTPQKYSGVNLYSLSPGGKYAVHQHSNASTPLSVHFVRTSSHELIRTYLDNNHIVELLDTHHSSEIRFVGIQIEDSLALDARILYPHNFDPEMKYPVLFSVYGEPWGQVATDSWVGFWDRYMAQEGYIVIDLDNRGTPCLKGSKWRKSIYQKIGIINADDQAKGAAEILKLDYVDSDRIAVWGASGGGSMTLNLLFRYGNLYDTGVSIAPVGNQLYYDNIYQERYMGLPQEDPEPFIQGSPITHAKNLKGNLLLIHGTADDNVHYQNSEALINELVTHNKIFSFMPYPNRTHSLNEGENTVRHRYSLMTHYIKNHCPPGPVDPSSKP
jgi:dipeptidyl-peptidase-4